MLVTFDTELRPLPVSVRVGNAVDVVGQVKENSFSNSHRESLFKRQRFRLPCFSGWQAKDHHRVPNAHNASAAGARGAGGTGDRRVYSRHQHHGGIRHTQEESRLLVDFRE